MKKTEFNFLVAGAAAGINATLLRKNGTDAKIVCKYDASDCQVI
jgi:hypothetical protein